MNFKFGILLFCSSVHLIIHGRTTTGPTKSDSLKAVFCLFRHGNRTPNGPEELYPNDPYLNETYYPFGLGQLTNAGKRKEYRIGKSLRERYNQLLGPYYTPDVIDLWSTDYNRTKMSLLLVVASLFPPREEEIWKFDLNWQPVPYNYLPRSQDKVLLGTLCPYYLKLYDEYLRSPRVQTELNQNRQIFNYISKNSGRNVTSYKNLYDLAFGLRAEEDWGFKLPEWTAKVWPQTITNLATKEYSIATGTTPMRQMASGYFLQLIIDKMNLRINGTNPGRKIYLYSAHEDNIANLLTVLDIFNPPHIPNYGAYLIFELHQINGKYGIKIYYENYVSTKLQLLKLPACETFCEMSKFISLTEEYIPALDLCTQK